MFGLNKRSDRTRADEQTAFPNLYYMPDAPSVPYRLCFQLASSCQSAGGSEMPQMFCG